MNGRGFGLVGNIPVGVIGGILGGYLFGALGISLGGDLVGSLVTALAGAIALLFVVGLIKKNWTWRVAQRDLTRPGDMVAVTAFYEVLSRPI